MFVLRLFPASIRRAFSLIGLRVRGLFADTPFFFFGVVLSLAVIFRAGAAVYRAAEPEAVPASELAPAAAAPAPVESTPVVSTSTPSREPEPVGAPARVAPKTRGHGRRLPRP